MPDWPTASKPLLAALALGVLWLVEGALPFFEPRKGRIRHDAANLILGLGNAAVASFAFAGATLAVTEAARGRSFGLLHLFEGPASVKLVTALVLVDLWQYAWHRLNHVVPVLWRFHAVHHADPDVDASTALRFHTGEILLSGLVRLAVLPVLGVTVAQLLAYEVCLLPIILFHHSNVRIPPRLDRILRGLIVTPWMHWVHHSDFQPETDSNFASVFSGWDRIFRTFRLREDPSTLRLGLERTTRAEERDLRGMLAMPFRARGGADRGGWGEGSEEGTDAGANAGTDGAPRS